MSTKAIVIEENSGGLLGVAYVAELNKCPPGTGLQPCTPHAVVEDARAAAIRFKRKKPLCSYSVYVLDGEAETDVHYKAATVSSGLNPPAIGEMKCDHCDTLVLLDDLRRVPANAACLANNICSSCRAAMGWTDEKLTAYWTEFRSRMKP